MKRCFAFDETDTALTLVDDRGCSVERLISDFTYDRSTGSAEAVLYSMFRLPHSNRTYFQCDVAICAGTCPKPKCEDIEDSLKLSAEGQLTQIEQEGSENVDKNGSEYSVEQDSEEKETNNYDDEDTENETGTESNNQNEGENQYTDEQLDDKNAATTLGTETATEFIG
mgnify:CR=1 FL=1